MFVTKNFGAKVELFFYTAKFFLNFLLLFFKKKLPYDYYFLRISNSCLGFRTFEHSINKSSLISNF